MPKKCSPFWIISYSPLMLITTLVGHTMSNRFYFAMSISSMHSQNRLADVSHVGAVTEYYRPSSAPVSWTSIVYIRHMTSVRVAFFQHVTWVGMHTASIAATYGRSCCRLFKHRVRLRSWYFPGGLLRSSAVEADGGIRPPVTLSTDAYQRPLQQQRLYHDCYNYKPSLMWPFYCNTLRLRIVWKSEQQLTAFLWVFGPESHLKRNLKPESF